MSIKVVKEGRPRHYCPLPDLLDPPYAYRKTYGDIILCDECGTYYFKHVFYDRHQEWRKVRWYHWSIRRTIHEFED